MKKITALFLALALLLSCAAGFADAVPEERDPAGIPGAGEVIQGFEVKDTREFPLVGGQLVLFEHRKTGAQLVWIANEDTNRAFQLTFLTRPEDDTGLPHVFEHATLFGSEKYPSDALFANVSYQTYNTYINAYTTDAMTSYPLASLSEEQLLALADYYVDSCFHPLIMTDEEIFRTQAWHYNLPDTESDMTYEGVVYSEMLGAMTLSRMALEHANDATFPGAALSYSYGGLPENIPEMTWNDVKAFHDKYYHPSNCLALLYGKLDHYEDFLKLLDGEFSAYEKREFAGADEGYAPITESVTQKFAYAMAEGTDVKNQSVISYYILLPGMKGDREQENLIDHICSMLSQPGSVLMQKMRAKFPTGSVSCGREVAAPDDAVLFAATGMNEDDAEAFKALVDEALAEVAADGFPADLVDSAMASLNISELLSTENGDPVETVVYSIAYDYAVTGDPFIYADTVEAAGRIGEENEQGLLKEAAAKWMTGELLYTLTTTYPAPGEKEKQDAALAQKLAEIKAGMSAEELQAVIDRTNATDEPEDTTELMAKIKVVDVESLPEEVRIYPVKDETDGNGIRHIDVTAGVDGIGQVQILLDAAALPQEDIHWMRLFTRILGQLDTDTHTKEEIQVLSGRYLYKRTIGVDVLGQENTVHPYLIAEWTAMDEDLAAGYELIGEILFRTQFTDAQEIAGLIGKQKTSVRNTINNESYSVMLYRGIARNNPKYAYYAYLNHLDYYVFLEELEQEAAENPEAVAEKLRGIQEFFRNNAGAVAAYAGNEESIALNRPLADAFLAGLDHTEREAVLYAFEEPSKREALVIDGNIQFNNVIATKEDMGLAEADWGLKAVASLVADQILWSTLRDGLGVYTPINSLMEEGEMYLISYRDPNIRETFAVYEGLADQLAAMETDQELLNGYILSEYSSLAKPAGELTGAVAAIGDTLEGRDPARKLTYMRQLKALTPESVKNAAELYRNAWKNGTHSTSGSAAKISEAADLYDVILNPFQVEAKEIGDFTDVPEGSEYYETVRYMVESGYMRAVSETEFGVENPATVGELLEGLSTLLAGGPMSAEDLRDALAGAGYLPADLDVNAELSEKLLCETLNPIGAGLTTDDPDHVMTRGELADLLMSFYAE